VQARIVTDKAYFGTRFWLVGLLLGTIQRFTAFLAWLSGGLSGENCTLQIIFGNGMVCFCKRHATSIARSAYGWYFCDLSDAAQ